MSIKLENINYIYEKNTSMQVSALKDINLTIEQGEFIGIIGHTGSGKSTLVQHLNGLLKATSGIIYYQGENIYQKGYSMKNLRSKVGIVFQYPEHQLFEETVLKDVCFGPKNMGYSEEEAIVKAKKSLQQVGIEENYFEQSPFELSGGQKRRVAIAGVLAMEPEVLILDEPTAGLDPKGRTEILDQIAALQKEKGQTIILVSHSMEDVAEYVDRIIVMNNGEILFDDKPENVFSRVETLEEIGLSAPKVTYIMRELEKKGLPIQTNVTTMADAAEEIIAALARKKGEK